MIETPVQHGPVAHPRLAPFLSTNGVHKATEPRLTICVLAACPFPANHGTPGSIREMSQAISALGHEVHIVTYHFGEDIPIHGPRVHRITPWTRENKVVVGPTSRRPLYDFQMIFKALEVIRHHQPDIIHAHGYEAALVAGACKLWTGLPVVYSGHNTMGDELASYDFIRPKSLADGLARLLDAFVPRIGNRCLPHSKNIQSFFHRMGLKKKTEPIVNFGIDLDWVNGGNGQRVRQQHEVGDAPVILYTGVLDQFQRIDLLLEAMSHVSFYEPEAKLLLVATIAQAKHIERIKKHAEALGVTRNIIITDPQNLDSIPDYLQAGDVAVVPRPQAPGFPIKLLNYMAASRPCVLFASSASKGLEHLDNCFLVASDSSAALGEGILEALRDRSLRQRLARNGHQFVRSHHDRKLIAQQICNTYLRTLGRPVETVSPAVKQVMPHYRRLNGPPNMAVARNGS